FSAGLALIRLVGASLVGGLACGRLALIWFRGIENDGGAGFILLRRRIGLQPVHLAARQGSRIKRAIRTQPHNLHTDVLGLEERERLAIASYTQHSRWGGGSQVGRAALVHGNGP